MRQYKWPRNETLWVAQEWDSTSGLGTRLYKWPGNETVQATTVCIPWSKHGLVHPLLWYVSLGHRWEIGSADRIHCLWGRQTFYAGCYRAASKRSPGGFKVHTHGRFHASGDIVLCNEHLFMVQFISQFISLYFINTVSIAMFKVLYCCTSVKGGVHTHFVDVWISNSLKSTKCVYDLALNGSSVVQRFKRSNASNGIISFYTGLPHGRMQCILAHTKSAKEQGAWVRACNFNRSLNRTKNRKPGHAHA